jgi:F0F1-type ATP synthase assembly protein I
MRGQHPRRGSVGRVYESGRSVLGAGGRRIGKQTMSQRRSSPRPRWTRYAGMGVELAVAIVGFCLLGIWIDYRYKTKPWGLLICSFLGVVGGMYNLIRQALQAVRDQPVDEHAESRDSDQDG